MSTRQAQEQIVTRFTDGKLLVDFRGHPQSNYATGGVTHRFNLLSRVLMVQRAQVEGTPYTLEAVEYGTGNAVLIKFYDSNTSGIRNEMLNAAVITPLNIDVTVVGY